MNADDARPDKQKVYDRYLGVALVSILGLTGFIAYSWYSVSIQNSVEWRRAVFLVLIVVFASCISSFPCAYRLLGYIPPASLLLMINIWIEGPIYVNGATIGVILGAAVKYLSTGANLEANQDYRYSLHSHAFEIIVSLTLSIPAGFMKFQIENDRIEGVDQPTSRLIVIGLSFIYLIYVWIRLFRPFFELCVEALISRNYRVTSAGPSAIDLPRHGPLIVIANHACWWDPLFLAKKLTRPTTPMMTSIFYDKWFIKPLVKYVFGAIRVEDARVRREAPEIQEAIRALDDGKCIVLFPEAFLRRKEEVPLRRFGRGVWEILKERPETPVVCCWIEGAWGSYSSFWNGPPTQNKVKERRRSISIGMSAPVTVPAEKLERHLATRIYLMNEVSAARAHVGIAPLPPFELPAKDDEATSEQST